MFGVEGRAGWWGGGNLTVKSFFLGEEDFLVLVEGEEAGDVEAVV